MPQSKLTDRTLKSLKRPKRGQVDYYDTDRSSPRGFGVRTSHTGAQTFFIKYIMPDGFGGTRQRRKMLETEGSITARYPEVSLADARELGFAFRRSLAAGKTAQDNGPRLPFGVLVTHYINNHAKAKKRSWKEDRRILNKYFADWHRHPADAITTAEIV
ncbi:MAG: Arm DNA-binding domain-containing protein, partial [Alphaproteobacteria bacterium]|nr:Arm DNA-binding domain-containing protein [Alphaproteobacteria bacterium]